MFMIEAKFNREELRTMDWENYSNLDVNYAYTCIQKCSEIDSEMAASELRKYTKNLFGKVTYRS